MKRTVLLAAAAAFSMNALAVIVSPAPTWRTEAEMKFANEPVASAASQQSAADDIIVRNLVDALNNDDQLKGAKITVMNDQGVALLTGRAENLAQMQRATQIASQFAGEGNVVNTIQPAKMSYQRPVPMPPDPADIQANG